MKVQSTELGGVLLLEPRVFRDGRGHFLETWNQRRYEESGVFASFVQDNVSWSRHRVLRGLHLQEPFGQAKLVSVLQGEVWDVVVDVRTGSDSFGRWTGTTLSAENGRQMFIPEGFAHGFVVTSPEGALFSYKCTEQYHPEAELTIRWNDPELAIRWPIADPVLSDKDRAGSRLVDVPPERLPGMSVVR